MSKKWRFTDRTRTLLTLELAIVLPAAALMGFSIWNLKHIQRDKAIEAAIQRDFSYVLKIAEKKSWEKASDLVTAVRKEFPDIDDSSKIKARLERILLEHPEYSYAALYDKKSSLLVSRVQPSQDHDAVFCRLTQEEVDTLTNWLPVESPGMTKSLRMMEEQGEPPVGFYGGWMVRDNGAGNWWHSGSLPGTTTIMVRTSTGFCWAALANTRTQPSNEIDTAIDQMMWNMVRTVPSWNA